MHRLATIMLLLAFHSLSFAASFTFMEDSGTGGITLGAPSSLPDTVQDCSFDANGRLPVTCVPVAYGNVPHCIYATVITPQDLADAQRDDFALWENRQAVSFVVSAWYANAGTDNTDLAIEEVEESGANRTTVDSVSITTDGTGLYYGSDTSILNATIEAGNKLRLDFDDTDAPTYVNIAICGSWQ